MGDSSSKPPRKSNADVAEWGCRALMDYARADNPANKKMVAEKEGLVALLAIMKMHATQVGVQREACHAVAYLALDSDVAYNCTLIGIPEAICTALQVSLINPTRN